ncbi:MAG: type I DNA topoisomerase [Candidatus Dojkabacteria bacterium]|nr:type I DNA topoisomerase [Candidatus Dojkabacteria bacterium]
MKLVIVESPSKSKTIKKYLGKEYEVVSSVGHIIDLPKSKIGVDLETMEPQYIVISGKEDVVKNLKKYAKKSEEVILATDPDREGEAISWHIQNIIKPINPNIHRITFHEITKKAIIEAIQNKKDINLNLVNAQQARRVLDRLVGYTLSPLLWKKIRYGISAGRVQSVALRLIVDREEEREKFVPTEYWSILVSVTENQNAEIKILIKNKNQTINSEKDQQNLEKENKYLIFELKKYQNKKLHISTEKDAQKIAETIKKYNILEVKSVNTKLVRLSPPAPFTTSTFQQEAINKLNLSASQAMRIAQKLYEKGLITYMRTDSTSLSSEAITNIRKIISQKYGEDYVNEKIRIYKHKVKNAQEAHEAIRPTNFETTELSDEFNTKENQVYQMIYKRALASQMSDAIYEQKTIICSQNNDELEFAASEKILKFAGWKILYNENNINTISKTFQDIKENDSLFVQNILCEQHFTEPPARYTEASLIKDLEKFGIGRPSTYASILSIITQRTYVSKEGKYLIPTEMGKMVTKFLKDNFSDIVDINFTAKMEDSLDKISIGELEWKPYIKSFFIPFSSLVKEKENNISKENYTILGESEEICDLCGAKMLKKIGKYGVFLSCSKFPECKGIKSIEQQISTNEEFFKVYNPPPKTDDGREFLLKTGRFGPFWAHPDYPKIKEIKPLEYNQEYIINTFGEPPVSKDGKTMKLVKGRYGYFWAHPDYPNIKEIIKIKRKTM